MNGIISKKFVLQLIDRRARARDERDYRAADAIRDALLKYGIILEDGRDGTTYRIVTQNTKTVL